MTKMSTDIHPAYIIKSYLWRLLTINQPNDWSTSNYDGKQPIVPLQEEPKISEYGSPFIVYGFAYDTTASLHARKFGSMTLAIYDDNDRRLGRTMNTILTALERQDEAARDVNNYSSGASFFHGLTFGYIQIGFVESGSPEETEGGRQSALINIRFEYHVDYDVVTNLSM